MRIAGSGQPSRMRRVQVLLFGTLGGRLFCAALGLGLLGLAMAQPTALPARKVTLTARPIPLSTNDPALERTGGLRYRGGLWLEAEDEGFGGLSGLILRETAAGPTLLAVTDQGARFSARLMLKDGRLEGLEDAALEPLTELQGRPVVGKAFSDAESLTRLPDGRILVGFERRHRIWVYGPDLTGPASAVDTPTFLNEAPSNGGLETLASWPDGRVLAIAENLRRASGNHAAFLREGTRWADLEWKASAGGFLPVDAAVLPSGDLLILERRFSLLSPPTLSSRIVRVRADSVRPGRVLEGAVVAELTAPFVAENFEGLAVLPTASGITYLAVVSDDNFSPAQRTLLLWFELPPEGTKPSA